MDLYELYQYLNCQGTITLLALVSRQASLYQYLNCQGTITKDGINNSRLLIFYGGSSNIYAEVGSATRIGQESGPTSFL